MSGRFTVSKNGIEAVIFDGQLVSITRDGKEFFHGGGLPKQARDMLGIKGWSNSEINMFPIVGPSFLVELDGENYEMDQHGVSRLIPFRRIALPSDSKLVMKQVYDGSKLKNPKHDKDSSHPEFISWLPYELEKIITVHESDVYVKFNLHNFSNRTMKYMFGWHPAFNFQGSVEDSYFRIDNKRLVSMSQVYSDKTTLIKGVNAVNYGVDGQGDLLRVSSEDFGNMMIWSPNPDSGMFCIEPVTCLPLDEGAHFKSGYKFEELESNKIRTYFVNIELL